MLYPISKFIIRFFLKTFFKFKIHGFSNLPLKGPYIIACNHASYLDPPVLGAGIPGSAKFLARDNLFKKGFLGWWVRGMGCIPVKRANRDTKAIKESIKTLRNGGVIAVFPEGTRSIDGSLREAKAGIGFLAYKSESPVIPAYIKGTKIAMPKHSRRIKLHPICIYFGEKVEPGNADRLVNGKLSYEKITRLVMSRIMGLKEKYGD